MPQSVWNTLLRLRPQHNVKGECGVEENYPWDSLPVNDGWAKIERAVHSHAKLSSKSDEEPFLLTPDGYQHRRDRFELQRRAKRILKSHKRLQNCLSSRSTDTTHRVIARHPSGVFYWANVQTCGSVWNCPVCSAKVSAQRRDELELAILRFSRHHGSVRMMTRTVGHTPADSLEDLLSSFLKAQARYSSTGAINRWRKKYWVMGQIRALEVTKGAGGWHPHTHEIVFISGGMNYDEEEQCGLDAYKIWASAATKEGLKTSLKGFHFGRQNNEGFSPAAYVAKWGLQHELTQLHTKKGREGALSPWDLLRLNDPESQAAFSEYAKAFHGRAQLHWSRGLKKLLGVDEHTDDDIASSDLGEPVVDVTDDQFQLLMKGTRRFDVVAELEQAEDPQKAFSAFLSSLKG